MRFDNKIFSLEIPKFGDHIFPSEVKYSIPVSDDGDTVKLSFPVLANATIEAACYWRSKIHDLIEMKNLTPAQCFQNVSILVTGAARDQWRDARNEILGVENPTEARFRNTMNRFMRKIGATSETTEILRELLTTARKPLSMTISEFRLRLNELNRYLPYLPAPLNNSLDDDVIFTTIKRCVPEWSDTMIRSNVHNTITTTNELISYYEGLEAIEAKTKSTRKNTRSDTSRNNNNTHKNSNGGNRNGKSNDNNTRPKYNPDAYCQYHDAPGHWTKDCKAKQRAQTANNDESNKSNSSKNHNANNNSNNNNRSQQTDRNNNNRRHGYNTRSQSRHEQHANQELSDDNSQNEQNSHASDASLYYQDDFGNFDSARVSDNQPTRHFVPELAFGVLSDTATNSHKYLRALVDKGASGSIVYQDSLPKLARSRVILDPKGATTWSTKGGKYITDKMVNLYFTLPELGGNTTHIKHSFKVDCRPKPNDMAYDVILGSDALQILGLSIDYSPALSNLPPNLRLGEFVTPMKPRGFWNSARLRHLFQTTVIERAEKAFERSSSLRPAQYKKIDLATVLPTHLDTSEQALLLSLLQKYETLFEGKLGCFPGKEIDITLKPDVKPYHGRAFPIPKSHEKLLRDEVDRLVKLGVLAPCTDSEWGSPSFGVPKKNDEIRFVSDFRQVNQRLVRHPFPLPSIPEVIRRLEGFTYATTLDISMGYWTLRLTPAASKICTIVLPWGKYCYLRLPMGLSPSPDIYQSTMSLLVSDVEGVLVYLDDILICTSGSFRDHLARVEQVLQRLSKHNLQVNVAKSSFAALEVEYVGFILTRDGVKPMMKRVQAIMNIAIPTNSKQVRSFLGMINYYRNMIPRRSHLIAPLTELTKKGAKFHWTDECTHSFNSLKAALSKQVCLAYPDFNKEFHIYTDASQYQLGAVIVQPNEPTPRILSFYSRKLTPTQMRYTVTDKELLSIVETLKEHRSLLLGQRIKVFTDHKNLTFMNSATDRVLRWKLIVDEYGAEIIYIPGVSNVVADTLSRLPLSTSAANDSDLFFLSDLFESEEDAFPLSFSVIAAAQQDDPRLQEKLKTLPAAYETRALQGSLIIFNDGKIVVPTSLQYRLLEWYHDMLLHPGVDRMYHSIAQHFIWANLRSQCESFVRSCETCQLYKKQRKHYGKLPPRDHFHRDSPWTTVAIDLIGPWTVPSQISDKQQSPLQLLALTIIDVATHLMEIVVLPDKQSYTVATAFDSAWLCRYPRPMHCLHDAGTEFTGIEFQELLQSYGIQSKVTTVKNPQANAILERTHQVIANLLRSSRLAEQNLTSLDDLRRLMSPAQWAMNTTFHTTLQASPGQLAFQRDMILPTAFLVDWPTIQSRRQRQTLQDNRRENASRIPHEYRLGDRVLIRRDVNSLLGKLTTPTEGPFRIVDLSQIQINGTVLIERRPNVFERIHLRRLLPFFESGN